MSTRTLQMTDALYAYLLENSLREADVLKRLRARTADLEFAGWQIAPEQGQFMALLVELIGARRCIEVGTRAVDLLRVGGLIAVDNVLWGGSVADPAITKSTTEAIRVLNKKVQADERVTMSLVPIGDGLLLARKR